MAEFHPFYFTAYIPLCYEELYKKCIENNIVSTVWGKGIDYTNCTDSDSIDKAYRDFCNNGINDKIQEKHLESIKQFRLNIDLGDLVFLCWYGDLKAVAKITGEYFYDSNSDFLHCRKVEWICKDINISLKNEIVKKRFIPEPIHEINKEDIKVNKLNDFTISNIDQSQNCVLIIDEINRGNISKIFGELLTLVEEDKRLAGENELTVTLPLSREKFGIPSNLYIIGTMNTADRSIALLDTALRRRFHFKEVMPDKDQLIKEFYGVDLSALLETINKRIEFLYDRDHTIGHSYFMEVKTEQDLIGVMREKILPLLQEYFYDDWDKIRLVLGAASDELLCKDPLNAKKLFGKEIESTGLKTTYKIKDSPNNFDFNKFIEVTKNESDA